jgi:two-component system cell cycle sensor histidine kinase/response regulator CckA
MDEPIAVLHLEDSAADAKLVAAALSDEGIECEITLVDQEAAYATALRTRAFDLILSDHNLPGFDGLEALRLAQTFCPDTPFISVSGAFGEETAAEIVRAGATDYVLKHRLFRLGRAVRRAVAESAERQRRARAEAEAQSLAEQLRHSQRLEAIGRLAGGVAHDFNNLLTVINGYCEQIVRKVPPDHELMPFVMPIYAAGQRGSELTRRLLAFSRHQVLAPRVISVNDVITELRPMLKALVGERIGIVLDLDGDAGLAYVDPAQMEQVVMNLATNARDAMAGGGTLTIETRNLHVGAARGALSPGDYVEIAVRDTGHGIDDELRAHIFEPFFTTKERGHGTGLGLPTAYGIVAQSGGEIDVESAVGRGTTMRIRLPLASGTPLRPVVATHQAEAAPGGVETLLLVEDDASVRELVADFLTSAGYTVIQASDAEQADAACGAAQGALDLLVSDVVLPGLDGPGLADRLRTRVPGLRALLISGYPGDAVVRPSPESGTTFLAKPFSRAVLLGKVREALGT